MKSNRLFNLDLWERALDLWMLENAKAAYSRRDAKGLDLCARKWNVLTGYLQKHGYHISTYTNKVGFRVI
jgi:hypothetical protein